MTFPFAGLYSDDLRSAYNRLLPNLPITVYIHGGTTLASLYTNRSKTTPVSNPTASDTFGNLTFYADPGLYDITADGETFVTVATVPDAGDIGGGGGSLAIQVNGAPIGGATTLNVQAGSNVTVSGSVVGGTVSLTVSSSGGGGSGTPNVGAGFHLFDVTTFGAVADNTTDCKAAFQNAFAALFASNAPGAVWVPWAAQPYRIILTAGDVTQGTAQQFANIKVPLRQHSSSVGTIVWGLVGGQGVNVVGRQFPGIGQTTPQGLGGAVIRLDYANTFTYTASKGTPCWIGGPDNEFATNGSTDVHWYMDGITIRSPDNPSLCAVNAELMQCATLGENYWDTNVAPDLAAEPTNPTGLPFLWPKPGNAAVLTCKRAGVWGWFAGVGYGEHLQAEYLFTVRCKLAFPIRFGGDHSCVVTQTVWEECPFGIGGLDMSSATGIVAVPGQVVLHLHCMDFEDFATGVNTWTDVRTKGSHIYDPNNQLRGRAWYMVINSTATAPVGATCSLLGFGATGFSMNCLLDNTPHILSAGHNPTTPGATVPQAPTIGTAVAGPASASVAFTANGNGGSPIINFTATSTPGGITGTGTSSPISVTGLTPGTPYTFTVHATNAVGNSAESAASNSATPSAPSGVSIFATPTPGATNLNDSQQYSLGTRFTISTNGHSVTNIRWRFPDSLPSGPVTGELWLKTSDVAGTLLGSVAFNSPTAGQWNTSAAFGSPISISTGNEYVAVVHTPDRYVATTGFFTGHTEANGILSSAADDTGTPDRNGILFIGAAGNYPSVAGGGACYFADVVVV